MRTGSALLVLVIAALIAPPAGADTIALGDFRFDSRLFGDTVTPGVFANTAGWVNVVNANPGSPGILTGANFNTGVFGFPFDFTIGYATPIVNGAGADLAIVAGSHSNFGSYDVRFTTADGVVTQRQQFWTGDSPATNQHPPGTFYTGVTSDYFHEGQVWSERLFVTPIDLTMFGLSEGQSIVSAYIITNETTDNRGFIGNWTLLRMAGFDQTSEAVPAPSSLILLGSGLALLAGCAWLRGRRRQDPKALQEEAR